MICDNTVAAHAFLLLLTSGGADLGPLRTAYSLFYCGGVCAAVAVPALSLRVLVSAEHLAPLAVLLLLHCEPARRALARTFRARFSTGAASHLVKTEGVVHFRKKRSSLSLSLSLSRRARET